MSDKDELPLSKGGGKEEEELRIGDMRFQKYKDNRVHVHDKDNVFCQADFCHFKLATEAFLSGPRYKEGTKVLFPGITSDPGGGRKACDLLLTRMRTEWKSELVACGTVAPDVVQMVDPVIFDLHEAVFGATSKIGNLRFQRDLKANEVTIASEANVSFVMEGIRKFELAIDGFLSTIGQYRGNVSLLLPGDGKKSDNNCDLVIQMTYGHWSCGLFFRGGFQADVVIGDKVLNDLDEIVQRWA